MRRPGFMQRFDAIGERLMQVTEINADGLKREYKVVVPAGQLETRIEGRLSEIARTVKIPGFRPGKVPMKLVRQKYGQAIMGEILEAAVNDGTQHAITESKVRPAVQPKVEIVSFAEGSDLEFKIELETLPEFTPMDFATIELSREKAAIPDEEVNETLARIAERNESSEAVDRASQDGDVVVIDFVGKQDGVAFPGGAAEDYQLKLGSGSFIPGFEEQLMGKKAGDVVDVKVSFPEEYGSSELAGKAAEFDVTLKEVRATKPGEVNDEMAKKVGLDSLDLLKQAIRDEIGRELDTISRAKVKRKLLDVLAANHDFPVPQSMVEQEFEAIWKQLEQDREAGRQDPADAGKSDDDLKAEYRSLSERRVRLGLLLAEVGRSNEVTVTQDDLNRALIEEARRYPGQEHLVFQYYKGNPDAMNAMRAPIFEEKVIDFILELAKVTDIPVSPADLRKDPDESEEGAEGGAAEAKAKPKKRTTKKKAEPSESAE